MDNKHNNQQGINQPYHEQISDQMVTQRQRV